MINISIEAIHPHSRGKLYRIRIEEKTISRLFTFHASGRIRKWGLHDRAVIEALLSPEEVLRGHHMRLIAHRRSEEHLIRIV
jgi:hypothetical protein